MSDVIEQVARAIKLEATRATLNGDAPVSCEALAKAALEAAGVEEMVEAAEALLDHYVGLVNSGDAGFWDPEKEDEVIAIRAALLKHRSASPPPSRLARSGE